MRIPRYHLQVLLLVASLMSLAMPQMLSAQQDEAPTIFKAESRSVLVDAVVTDHKGNPVRDLTQKNFHVFEDGKEQALSSFSYVSEDKNSDSPAAQRYIVLFFDYAAVADDRDHVFNRVRADSLKFVDALASPNRLISVVNYNGTLKVAVDFTSNVARVKQALGAPAQLVERSTPSPDIAAANNALTLATASYGEWNVFIALRRLAKSLANVPGRKTLIWVSPDLTIGFSEANDLRAAINECNHANVAIYPIDARGLASVWPPQPLSQPPASPKLVYASLNTTSAQRGGTGGGGTGGGTGGGGGTKGGTGGTTGGTTGTTGGSTGTRGGGGGQVAPALGSRFEGPWFSPINSNNEVLWELASGTGGFLVHQTNDLLDGFMKIGRDLNQYYLLSYIPSESKEGQCHTLKVKVDRGGTEVRARTGYCNVKPLDMLAGKLEGRDLETKALSPQVGNIASQPAIQTPYFYTQVNVARVNLAMNIPSAALKTSKESGKLGITVNVLGIASRPDKSVAARFSDRVYLKFEDKQQLEQTLKRPLHYEKQFEIPGGEYLLTLVFSSDGKNFGKLQTPLSVDPYDGKRFTMSSVALGERYVKADEDTAELEAGLIEDRTPLIARGMELTPMPKAVFKKGKPGFAYVELYESEMASAKSSKSLVGIECSIEDRATGKRLMSSRLSDVTAAIQPNDPVVRLALQVDSKTLPTGSYTVVMQATDFLGNKTQERRADFEVE